MDNTVCKERRGELAGLHLLLSVFLIFWMNGGIMTFLNGITGVKYIKVLLLLAWGMLALHRDPKFFQKVVKLATPLLVFMCCVQLERMLGISEYRKHYPRTQNNIVYMLIITAILVFSLDNLKKREIQLILFAWLLDIVVCGIITLHELEMEPLLSRILTTENPAEYMGKDILPKGILSYGNAYSLVFCAFSLCLYLKKEYGKKRIVVVALLGFMVFVILKMQFATAFLMILLSFVLFAVWSRYQEGKKILVLMLLLILFLVMYLFSVPIIEFLIKIAGESDVLVERLEEVKAFALRQNLAGTDLNARLGRYIDSFKAIFSNCFMGALIIGEGEIGGHSEFLDCFALYGLFPALCLIVYFRMLLREITQKVDISLYGLVKMVFLQFLVLSIVNTSLWSPITLVLILIVPLMFLNATEGKKSRC